MLETLRPVQDRRRGDRRDPVSASLVDWRLAERLAVAIARRGRRGRAPVAAEACDRRASTPCARRRSAWSSPTRGSSRWRRSPSPSSSAEPSGRATRSRPWASWPASSSAAARRDLPAGPLGRIGRSLVGIGAGTEAGSPPATRARRVLGQYDIALVGAERPPRLLFVGAEPTATATELGDRGRRPSCAGSLCTRRRTPSSSPQPRGFARTSAGSSASAGRTGARALRSRALRQAASRLRTTRGPSRELCAAS